MKKTLCMILLLGIICTALSGCAEKILGGIAEAGWKAAFGVSPWEQKAMLKHLEEKYGGKFVIDEVLYPENESNLTRSIWVYPEGREEEGFLVNLGPRGRGIFIDKYVLREPEKRMTPLYEEWIQSTIPTAKVSISLSMDMHSKELFYNPDETLQEFVSAAENRISIDVNIMLEEDLLKAKDEIFEKLAKLFENDPIEGYWSREYRIGFCVQKAFENVKSGEWRHIPEYLNPMYEGDDIIETAKEFVAITSCIDITNSQPKWDFLEQLNFKFETREEAQ